MGRGPEPGAADVAYVVDLSTWAHRFFHATPLFDGANGKPANAVKGVAQMVARLFRDRDPGYLAIAFDSEGKTFRHDIFPEYKAARKKRDDALTVQLDAIRELFQVHQIACVEKSGFEADDIIASLVKVLRGAGKRVVIVALDKDLQQLIDGDDVVMWDAKDRFTNADDVREKWNVDPTQLVDVMALIGDPTDGIPGVKGVGRKGACNLVHKRGDLETVLEKASWETPSMRDKLLVGAEDARMSQQLIRLRDDIDLGLTVDQLIPSWDDAEPIRAFYLDYGFDALAKDVSPLKPR